MPNGPSHQGGRNVASVAYTKRFEKDLKKIKKKDSELYANVLQAIEDLLKDPRPGYLRFEKLQNPDGVYTVHVRGNVKISMEFDGDAATLRRVANHDTIDSSP